MTRTTIAIALEEMTAQSADKLAKHFAQIDPWLRLAIPANRLRRLFEASNS